MKIFLGVLLVFTLFFLGLCIYTVHYQDHGADGLSGFFMAIFYGGLFLIFLIGSASLSTIILLPNTSNVIRFFTAAIVSVLIAYIVFGSTFLPAIGFW